MLKARSGWVLATLAVVVSMVGAPMAAADAASIWIPRFGLPSDPYASYVGQSFCDPTAKPGVEDFRELVLARYPWTDSDGIIRACGIGKRSEHKEGRAWDWDVSAKYERESADELLGWLLATRNGERHALLRRFGIMYIIWDGRIFRSYDAELGWQPYMGTDPHTSHMHFSFSWAGACRRTTWWQGRQVLPWPMQGSGWLQDPAFGPERIPCAGRVY